jgi:hypothetical protein
VPRRRAPVLAGVGGRRARHTRPRCVRDSTCRRALSAAGLMRLCGVPCRHRMDVNGSSPGAHSSCTPPRGVAACRAAGLCMGICCGALLALTRRVGLPTAATRRRCFAYSHVGKKPSAETQNRILRLHHDTRTHCVNARYSALAAGEPRSQLSARSTATTAARFRGYPRPGICDFQPRSFDWE